MQNKIFENLNIEKKNPPNIHKWTTAVNKIFNFIQFIEIYSNVIKRKRFSDFHS